MLKPLIALTFAFIAAPAALACSCAPCAPFNQPGDPAPATSAFVGELISVRRDSIPATETSSARANELVYLFHVTRPVKGDVPKYVLVRTRSNPVACGTSFSFEGLNAVAVSRRENGEYTSSSCLQMCWRSEHNRALVPEDTVQTRRR